MGRDVSRRGVHYPTARDHWPSGARLKCHFCDKELPEPGHTHIFYCSGTLKRVDGDAVYPVCIDCRKRMKLKDEYLRNVCQDCGEPT